LKAIVIERNLIDRNLIERNLIERNSGLPRPGKLGNMELQESTL
jgi:hypothetical protein